MRATRRLCIAFLSAIACATACVGQQAKGFPKFQPHPMAVGVIRSWGDDAMGGVMSAWEDAFRKYHPEITFQTQLYGSGTGMAGIITGVSDLSLMGRSATPNEIMGFEWVFRYKPLGIQVMTGSLKEDGKSPAIAVFVSKSNPVTQISITRLATILGCHGESEGTHPPTWSDAGAQGAWADKAIHGYLYDSETGTGAFLQQAVLGAEDRWNWSVVKEFKGTLRADGTLEPAGQQTLDALKKDPNGIAVSTLDRADSSVKALALSRDGAAVELSRESLIEGTYPLTRGVYIYVNRNPEKPVDVRVLEFVRFILSREGQEIVRLQGDYLPLNVKSARDERKKLE